jgi:hypothetical protein
LHPDPLNVRQHNPRNIGMIADSIGAVGVSRSGVIDEDGTILAGNGTFEALAQRGIKKVQVIETDGEEWVVVQRSGLTDTQKRELSIADNRASDLATWDGALLKAQDVDLTAFFSHKELSALRENQIFEQDNEEDNEEEEISEDPDHINIYAYRVDAVFPSRSNAWDIPDLRADLLSAQVPHSIWAGQKVENAQDTLFLWGTNTFPREAQGGVLGFYVDDKRFVTVWTHAVQIIEKMTSFGWGAVLSPDFSLWRNWPLSIQLFNLYRSRWCARYWQEAGIPIIPSLNWSDERTYDWAFKGIPKGTPVVSAQCRTLSGKDDHGFFLQGILEGIRQIEPQKVLLYGGADHREWLEPTLGGKVDIEWLESWTTVRRRIRF